MKAVFECDATNGDSCYYNGGVKTYNSNKVDRVEGNFVGQLEEVFEGEDGDVFFFTVYNPNDTPAPYTLDVYLDGALVWDCADSLKHKDNGEHTCNYSFTLGE